MEFPLLAMLILGVMQQSLACTYTPSRQEITVFGTRKFYCDYAVGSANSTVKLSVIPGSRFRTSECSECHCTRNGLQCCGQELRPVEECAPPHFNYRILAVDRTAGIFQITLSNTNQFIHKTKQEDQGILRQQFLTLHFHCSSMQDEVEVWRPIVEAGCTPECRVLPDGCEPRLVLKSDNKSECKPTRPPVRPRLEQTISSRVQTGSGKQQATNTLDNKWQAMSTVTRQVQGNQPTGNQGQGQVKMTQAPGNRRPGNQASRNRAQGNQAPINQGLGNQGPRNQAPGKQTQLKQAPGNQASGNRAPVIKSQGNQAPVKASGNQGQVHQKSSTVQGTAPSSRLAQIAATPAPVKPTIPAQRRRPAPRPRPQNRSWRFNPFHHRGQLTEESMQFMQNMMLFRALSSGNSGPLQSMMLMNMFEM